MFPHFAIRRGLSRTIRPCRYGKSRSQEVKSDFSLRDAECGSEASRRTIEGGCFMHSSFNHVYFVLTLDALGHPVLAPRTPLCELAKPCRPAVHPRTSSRPLKRSSQDDKKQQGGGKWHQDSGEELQQDRSDELQQEGHVCLGPPWCLACAAWNLAEHRDGQKGNTFVAHSLGLGWS